VSRDVQLALLKDGAEREALGGVETLGVDDVRLSDSVVGGSGIERPDEDDPPRVAHPDFLVVSTSTLVLAETGSVEALESAVVGAICTVGLTIRTPAAAAIFLSSFSSLFLSFSLRLSTSS